MAKAAKKRPWLKFYPQDWRGDPKLRMCSIGARGLWVEMICLMHEAEPYGHLLINKVPVTNRQLAILAGIPQADCMKYLLELESSGVYSRTPEKTIFSRRMVRDEEKSLQGKKDIEKRWGDRSNSTNPSSPPNRSPSSPPTGDPITLEAICQKDAVADDAREPIVSDQAIKLADELMVIAGHDPQFTPPGWCGAAMRVHTWLANGWPPQVIVAATRSASARKHGTPPNSVQFFEKAIAEEVARQAAPLPQVETRQPETLKVIANGKSGNVVQAADRLLEKIRSFDAGSDGPDGIHDRASSAPTRLLSQG